MRKYIIPILIMIATIFPVSLLAQDGSIPVAILEYFDNPSEDMVIRDRDGNRIEFYMGMTLNPGATVFTGSGIAELKLTPNGSILKLGEGTSFELTELAGRGESDTNIFSLFSGKLRTIAAHRGGKKSKYSIVTDTAVCGIRGTDLINDLTPGKESVTCIEGLVEVSPSTGGDSVLVGAGQQVNTVNGPLNVRSISKRQMNRAIGDMNFVKADPDSVPGKNIRIIDDNPDDTTLVDNTTSDETVSDATATDDTVADATASDETASDNTVSDDTVADATASDEAASDETASDETASDETASDETASDETASDETASDETASDRDREYIPYIPVPTIDNPGYGKPSTEFSGTSNRDVAPWLRNLLGFNAGTITVDGETWAMAVLEPQIKTKQFAMGFYLPVIYSNNLLDFESWYSPGGNNEWSFGSDQEIWYDILIDINRDLWSKIRYISYGDAMEDPFYIKLGNVNDMSLGHGTLVHNFANDYDFPAVRKIGLNAGLDIKKTFQVEFLADDLGKPQIFGTRMSLHPIKSYKAFGFGLTSIFDLYAADGAADRSLFGDPWLWAMALDFEFFRLNLGILDMLLYMDISTALPVFRNNPAAWNSVESGAAWDHIWDGGPKNFGVQLGVTGDILFFDYRLEARYTRSSYQLGMFNESYSRNKLDYITQTLDSLQSGTQDVENTLEIYGEAGFNIVKDKLHLTAGYLWPLEMTTSGVAYGEDDYLSIGIVADEGIIPKYGLHGSIVYERRKFVQAIVNDNFNLFDGNSVIKGELIVPILKSLDFAVVISTSTKYNNGQIVYGSDGVTPQIVPVFFFETRVRF